MNRDGPEKDGISRRRFLRDAGTLAAAGALAGPSSFAGARSGRPVASGKRVAILGGGMGGLAAAHELAERGFDVTVYERKALGGKARSIPVPRSGVGGRRDLPGEHGFRFFPGFYHHVPDTMRRIPYPGNADGVFGNLVDASTATFARSGGREDITLYVGPPPSGEVTFDSLIRVFTGLAGELARLPPQEAAFFARQMTIYVTSSEERRFGQWEYTGWWDFVGAAPRSEEYKRMLAIGVTRNLVAAKAEIASTRTVGAIAEAFFTNALYRDESQGEGAPDRVLNGPTNEAWIDPWLVHLQKLGVRFRVGQTVEGLDLRDGRIASARVRDRRGRRRALEADWFVGALPVERARRLWTPRILSADPGLAGMDKLLTAWMTGIQFYLDRRLPVIHGHYSFVDSPWALTSLDQQQFWAQHDLASGYGDGRVRDILSVDVSNWEEPGIIYGRPARELSGQQIANEVWAQIKAHLNDTGREVILDEALVSWFLDPAIRIRRSRKGRRLKTTNDDPLLVNTIGSWDHRPEARTAIPNLFLAADFVRTNIDLATMEGANEAGRRAVNSLLEAAGSKAEPARLYRLFEHPEMAALRQLDAERYRNGQPHVLDTPWPDPPLAS